MTTSGSDISIVLSGGSSNINPNLSLGGDPSSSPIPSGVLNNLFDDISSEESAASHEDYRCIYIFNDGDTIIWDIRLWIEEDEADGSTTEIGIENRNETQRITINGGVNGGTLTLSYNSLEFTIAYDSDLAVWAQDLQDKLDDLEDGEGNLIFRDVTVTAQNASGGVVIFDIRWAGKDGKRNFDSFTISSGGNLLEPLGSVTVGISTPQQGAPINTIAAEINVETTPPGGVSFFASSVDSPITLPRLESNEGFPLWIKRVTEANTTAKENDGVVLRFSAQSLESV